MKRNIFKAVLAGILMACVLPSCSYLDVSDELAGGINDLDDVFSNVDRTKRWYGQIYKYVPDYSRVWGTSSGLGNFAVFTDELYTREGLKSGRWNEYTASVSSGQRWYECYEGIRQCNIFIEQAHEIIEEGTNAQKLTQAEVNVYKANAKFMRAALHFFLFEHYGPIPIVKNSFDAPDPAALPLFERNSVEEVVTWIDEELKTCIPDMEAGPNYKTESKRAVPDQGTALALRAKLWVFAASDLYNGTWEEGKTLANKDGKLLFPEDPAAFKEHAVGAAIEHLQSLFAKDYSLYKADDGNPYTSLYELFQGYYSGKNKEIIWATSSTSWGSLTSENFDKHSTPRCEPLGVGGMDVLQELVDDFYASDGLPVTQTSFLPVSKVYNPNQYGTVDSDGNGINDSFAGTENRVHGMFCNREPRFYNTVTFSGRQWMSGNEVQFYYGGNCDITVADGRPWTGYLLFKRYNKELKGNATNSKFRPSIVFRLADFYLYYAEMLNEQSKGQDSKIIEYIDKVRERAGIPTLESMDMTFTYEQLRDIIRRERRVELATEGQRYYDVRRWLVAEEDAYHQGGDFHGLNVFGTKENFAQVVKLHTRSFKKKNYFFPIPLTEIQRNENLVQNPGW